MSANPTRSRARRVKRIDYAALFIIGDPVMHSLSPEMQGAALARAGIRGSYVPIRVEPARLAKTIEALERIGFAGGNVTLPHKERVFPLLASVSETARAIGAVNCLTRTPRGFAGDNTDGPGFRDAVERRRPGLLRGGRVLLLGAGGAARAVLHAAGSAGAEYVLVLNRTASRARRLARDAGGGAGGAAARGRVARDARDARGTRSARSVRSGKRTLVEGAALADASLLAASGRGRAAERFDVIVNATRLGLDGRGGVPVPASVLSRARLVVDLVYTRGETPFVAAARARGVPVIDGIEFLAAQGRLSFEHWFGAAPDWSTMLRGARSAWKRRLSERA
jgi:shikimate dehydrogenase